MLTENADLVIDRERSTPTGATPTGATPTGDRSQACEERHKKIVQLDQSALSDQTRQLLAVRDQRDRAAFAALFDHFAPRLKGMVIRGGTQAGQAEEIVQEVMLTVWRKAGQFDPHRAQASAWIYQIARNRSIDVARKENRPVPEVLKQEPEEEADAGQLVALGQETHKLKAAMAELKPDQREMIEKAYLGEMTHQEISTQTGLPLGTIKSRIRLGLQRLRHDLKELR